MNTGKYVFSQIAYFLPTHVFENCVTKYQGNRYVKHFTCWNQLMCMMFGQLSGRDSLRDLLVSITPHKQKYYHLGFGRNVTLSNLALCNEQRDYRIYEDFAYAMIAKARSCTFVDEDFKLNIPGSVYAFDSTLIDLCLSVFWWAEFRTTKAAVKIHTLIDIKTSIPCYVHITEGAIHDVHGLDALKYESGGFYVMDRGYVDFYRLFKIQQHGAYFVTRAKTNMAFTDISLREGDSNKGISSDKHITLNGHYSAKDYPEILRRIAYFDSETKKSFIFLTNNFELPAEDIALLYKYRWKIELFFKWIKQHLKIKSFWGISSNAVKTQIYIAIITYTLIVVIKNKLKSKRSNYEILQILGVSLLDKTPIVELLSNLYIQDVKEQNDTQLKIELF